MAKTTPEIHITKHPEFRVIYASGAWILVKADEGFLKFYLDIAWPKIEPKIKAEGQVEQMKLDKINREFQVEIRMSTAEFLNTANNMTAYIKELQKKGILTAEKKPPKEGETYRI